MPPRRRPPSGYHGVRGAAERPIRRGDPFRRGSGSRLGTFDTAHEAARSYDAVAWRLGRSRRAMNFHDVFTREQAEMLAPPPMITREQRAPTAGAERRFAHHSPSKIKPQRLAQPAHIGIPSGSHCGH
nr:ethylene-responsive transcription factor 2-like [Lolium perenne]